MRTQQTGFGQRTTAKQPASKQYAGHQAGIPEEDYGLEEDEAYYVTRPHTSTRRYDLQPQVIRQGNRQYTIHHGAPPVPRRQHQYIDEEEDAPKPRRRVHWFVYLGIFFIAVVAFSFALISVGNWWTGVQEDWTYGQTRTFQIDAIVGHGDSSTNPTHFIAENLNGQIIVIEISRSDPTKARRYNVTTILGNEGNPPVRLSFQDVNADGKLDMLVQIGDTKSGTAFTITLFNDGTQFVSKLR